MSGLGALKSTQIDSQNFGKSNADGFNIFDSKEIKDNFINTDRGRKVLLQKLVE
jgi:hypothetical protein